MGASILAPLVLDAEQEAAVAQALADTSGGWLLASDRGTGKTLIAVEYVKRSKAQTVLLIAPLQTKGIALTEGAEDAEGWHGTFDLQRVGLPFRQIDSSVSGQKALADFSWGIPGIYFVGHQMFTLMGWMDVPQYVGRGDKKVPKMVKNKKTGKYEQVIKKERTTTWDVAVDVIIFDEVHRAQNPQSGTWKTLRGGGVRGGIGAPKSRLKNIGASGTYEGNSFDGAWGITKWLWPDLIDDSIYVWRHKWAETEYDHFAVRNERVVGELVEGAFVASLPCYTRIEADFNIEVIEKTFEVDLYPEQRRVYDELILQNVAWIKDHPMVTKFPMTRRTRLRQVTLGMPTLTKVLNKKTREWETDVSFDLECASSTVDTILSKILPKGKFFDNEPAILFTDSQQFARVLTYRLNKAYGEGTAREWSGKVSRKVRDADKAAFLKGEYKYFVAVVKAAGTGTDLLQKVCWNMLYVSLDDSRIENEQGDGRTIRRGQVSEFVRKAYMVRRDTIDGGQKDAHIENAIRANKRMKTRR